jgi:manganese transport protein
MIPLLVLTCRKDLMGAHANRPITNALAVCATVIILAMNIWLLFAIATGKS